jgi:Na+-transporting methylmalonyl-CoA/oxaloacetate decarboxylase beta subunit
MKELYVHLFHILIVGTLFLYVGIMSTNVPTFMFPVLLGLGAIIVFYHIYKTYLKVAENKNPWVNLFHIFIVGPLLIYIGYNKQATPRPAYEFLLMLGFASIGYHGYYAINSDK